MILFSSKATAERIKRTKVENFRTRGVLQNESEGIGRFLRDSPSQASRSTSRSSSREVRIRVPIFSFLVYLVGEPNLPTKKETVRKGTDLASTQAVSSTSRSGPMSSGDQMARSLLEDTPLFLRGLKEHQE